MHHRTILVVDPDGRLRGEWRAGLEGMGFQVKEAMDAANGLRAAMRAEITLLITELYLPSPSGHCLVRVTRREAALRRLKILVVTEHSSDEDRAWALASGADAYLTKPVPLGRMLQVSARLASTRTPSRGEMRAGW